MVEDDFICPVKDGRFIGAATTRNGSYLSTTGF